MRELDVAVKKLINNKTKSYTVKDFYKYFLTYSEDNIDYALYRSIITDYFKLLRNEILEKSKMIKLPSDFGNLMVVKRNYGLQRLSVDHQASKQYGKRIYHLNEHTSGFKYGFYWFNDVGMSMSFKKRKYMLIATRANKRRLAEIIKNREHDFLEK